MLFVAGVLCSLCSLVSVVVLQWCFVDCFLRLV